MELLCKEVPTRNFYRKKVNQKEKVPSKTSIKELQSKVYKLGLIGIIS